MEQSALPVQEPAATKCKWPGCARPPAQGKPFGPGARKEYCELPDPDPQRPTIHNARNFYAG